LSGADVGVRGSCVGGGASFFSSPTVIEICMRDPEVDRRASAEQLAVHMPARQSPVGPRLLVDAIEQAEGKLPLARRLVRSVDGRPPIDPHEASRSRGQAVSAEGMSFAHRPLS
jgi:hypothetical protein